MRKREEVANPSSCLNRAREDEMIFVLLGRDVATPAAIRMWFHERLRLGKNRCGDAQMIEALQCAATIVAEHKGAVLPTPAESVDDVPEGWRATYDLAVDDQNGWIRFTGAEVKSILEGWARDRRELASLREGMVETQ